MKRADLGPEVPGRSGGLRRIRGGVLPPVGVGGAVARCEGTRPYMQHFLCQVYS